eukprot:CAMPEP_0196179634 /NCGR_PEP_ID=MMETSP0911-20130528/21470_1 /TAXON_ID=49265 /ORGANISM="Thalassiosira rotula, Strain GSO102" /LENGTH=55 /DNA_ID=CAMNT_0041448471 /DNA_START=1 /DNA_END=168 /DNA_ORIENTATION=-
MLPEQCPTTVHATFHASGAAASVLGSYPAWPQWLLNGSALHSNTNFMEETLSPSS